MSFTPPSSLIPSRYLPPNSRYRPPSPSPPPPADKTSREAAEYWVSRDRMPPESPRSSERSSPERGQYDSDSLEEMLLARYEREDWGDWGDFDEEEEEDDVEEKLSDSDDVRVPKRGSEGKGGGKREKGGGKIGKPGMPAESAKPEGRDAAGARGEGHSKTGRAAVVVEGACVTTIKEGKRSEGRENRGNAIIAYNTKVAAGQKRKKSPVMDARNKNKRVRFTEGVPSDGSGDEGDNETRRRTQKKRKPEQKRQASRIMDAKNQRGKRQKYGTGEMGLDRKGQR